VTIAGSEGGALLDAVRGVRWPARRVSRSMVHGAHRSRRVGASPEFMEYRPYQQGDDASRIDWKLFARTERVAVRLAHDDSSIGTMVLLDASASMAFPAETREKWRLAAQVALGLCAVAHNEGDPVGIFIATEDTTRELSPRTRRDTVANVMRLISGVEPRGRVALAQPLAALRTSRRVAIVSDFLADSDELLQTAGALAAEERELFAVHVVAREELDPSPLGVVTDPEATHLRRSLQSPDLAAYREAFAAWRDALASRWRALGASYHLVTTGEPPDRIVRRIVAPVAVAARG
jgi:uncharacterized protein (DUF58 family)